ncbi:MAG: hypothetical protein GC184_09405 [Rhizobiales bacterium]|nr:hypothetical protein [Hyphomicrobiales bacterium]
MTAPLRSPFTLEEDDPQRIAREAQLRAMSETDMLALYHATQKHAAAARKAHDMKRLLPMVRGMKTIQRLAAERGLVIRRAKLSS